ncbi:amylo-alpha-1,6-glucosidase [Phycisphaerales bacterium AB-hyl4]|uniref:Amylo-alpha-1,6-glucosidase n=1 Tax=Natronomicrosphaera hydrolytica TaxID=3242702 RepID=A0ABV4UBB0_9BACT
MNDMNWRTHDIEAGDDPTKLIDAEWLLTNGTGGYAMGTALGCPTRRYHGLLVAATQPPAGRMLAVNQMWEQLVLRRVEDADALLRPPTVAQPLEFSTLAFAGDAGLVFAPQGHAMLQTFERGLSVKWTYQWGRISFERELFLHWKQQAITLRYRIRGLDEAGARATLRLQPMLTLRDFHATLRRGHSGAFRFEARRDRLIVRRDGQAVTFACPGSRFEPNEHWWYNVHYPLDAERGQDCHEDYFVPGLMEVELDATAESEVLLTAALGEQPAKPMPNADARSQHLMPMRERVSGFSSLVSRSGKPETNNQKPETTLAIAADDFVVDRAIGDEKLSTIIAGYPWFGDWGRDTFIALPGLLLDTGRCDEARAVLRAFARSIRDGLVPNRFDDYDASAAHYNTVDASLWFINAALKYLEATGDDKAWHDWLAHACLDIVHHYQHGTGGDVTLDTGETRPLIGMDDDGLIFAGTNHTQLTWMDAACGDVVFTPRPGKCVEINALWHHALCALADHLDQRPLKSAGKQSDATASNAISPADLRKLADKVKRSFNKRFWNAEGKCLYDHIADDGHTIPRIDTSIRPNQAFVVASAYCPLPVTKQRQVLKAVRDQLLTPVGLRTLPDDDRAYHPHYTGDQFRRDEAYHQGTIWPWLIGAYAEGVLRVGKFSDKARKEAMLAIAPLLEHLQSETSPPAPGGVGQLAEIYEAQPDSHANHRPVGCPAQAWSVAEVLRICKLASSKTKP